MTEDADRRDRRTVLQAIGAAGAFGLAGCVGGGGGTEDPGVETDDPTRTETRTATPTRTTASGPKPTASVSIEEDGDTYTVTLVSLGASTDRVELAGCGSGQTLSNVGDESTAASCGSEDPLKVFAVAGEGGTRALVDRYPGSPATGAGGNCDRESGDDPTAAISVDRSGDEEANVTVTLASLGTGVRGIRLHGCVDGKTVNKVGGSTTVTGCSEGDVVEVVAVGCDGETQQVHEVTV